MDYKNCPYDDLFKKYAALYKLHFKLIRAQAWQESRFDADAVSDHGAVGILQLMPATAREFGLKAINFNRAWSIKAYLSFMRDSNDERLDPEKNIDAAVKYLRIQYDHFPEIGDMEEKLKFSLAAYNGGRQYCNVALRLARLKELGSPTQVAVGSPSDLWQNWAYTSRFLADPLCFVKGNKPDHKQITDYVEKIWAVFIPDVFEMEV